MLQDMRKNSKIQFDKQELNKIVERGLNEAMNNGGYSDTIMLFSRINESFPHMQNNQTAVKDYAIFLTDLVVSR